MNNNNNNNDGFLFEIMAAQLPWLPVIDFEEMFKVCLPHIMVTLHLAWTFSWRVQICVKHWTVHVSKICITGIHTYTLELYFLSDFKLLKLANIFENMNITQYNAHITNMLKIINVLNYVHNKTRGRLQCY